MNIAPTTATAISPANTPMSVCAIVTPSPAAPATDGRDVAGPAHGDRPPSSVKPPGPAAGPPASPMAVPVHPAFEPAAEEADVVEGAGRLARAAGHAGSSPPDVCQYGGDVANRPPCTVDGSPVRVAVPTLAQCAPSAES